MFDEIEKEISKECSTCNREGCLHTKCLAYRLQQIITSHEKLISVTDINKFFVDKDEHQMTLSDYW